MRRFFVIPALMISLLLTGCGDSAAAQRKVEEQQAKILSADELDFTADITANLSREVFNCTLECHAEQDEISAELVSPEAVAGVRARIKNGGVSVEYDDISLGVGTAGLDSLTPVSAVSLLITALRSGFLQRCWTERDGERELIAVETYVTDEAELTIWYDAMEMTPLHCEFSKDGSVIVGCEIRDFTIK